MDLAPYTPVLLETLCVAGASAVLLLDLFSPEGKKGRVGARTFTQDLSVEYNQVPPNFDVPTNYAKCNTAALIAPAGQ